MKKIFIFLIVSIIIPSCYWSKPCEEYYIYKLENYRLDIIDYKFEKKYSDYTLYISADNKFIEETGYCSYMEDSFINYITKIDIFSETDYNQSFPAGINLNNLFVASPYQNYYPIDTLPCKEVVGINYNQRAFTIFLVDKPAQRDTFIFFINIEINDGSTYNFETLPVIITP